MSNEYHQITLQICKLCIFGWPVAPCLLETIKINRKMERQDQNNVNTYTHVYILTDDSYLI